MMSSNREAASTSVAKQIGHRVDNALLSDKSQAHFGDVNNMYTTTNHYHVNPSTSSNTYQLLLASLTFDRMDERVRDVAAALSDTSGWLPSHPKFTAWIDENKRHENHGFLWLKGKPGSGKSTIMKETLEWARRAWSDQIVLAYFFNARSPYMLEKSSLGLYRSLVWQLLSLFPGCHVLFTEQFRSKLRQKQVAGRIETEVEVWKENELQNFLVKVIKDLLCPPIAIFVDALDEGIDDDVRAMITFLESCSQYATAAACSLRICLSSRHYPHISVVKSLSVIVEQEKQHDEDIDLYIRQKLICEVNPETADIRRQLHNRSAGVFLWVVLVVPMLNKAFDQGRKSSIILQKLETIPQDLHDVFTQILFKDLDDIDESVLLLQMVLYAKRPLDPIELYCALQCGYFSSDSNEPSNVAFDVATKYLLHCSHGLIELTQSHKPGVQFIHETVRACLIDGRLLEERGAIRTRQRFSKRDFEAGVCHAKLSEVCLGYMLHIFKQPDSLGAINMYHPFAHYAAEYWWQHYKSSQHARGEKEYTLALELLVGERRNLLSWIQLYDLDYQSASPWKSLEQMQSPLYYIALMGQQDLLLGVLMSGVDVNTRGGRYFNALSAASVKAHLPIVQILLEHRAKGRSMALRLAAGQGHRQIVQLLLDHGATNYADALLEATENGRIQIVQDLLDRGAYIGNRAFGAASSRGHEQIVQLFLDKGVDVDMQLEDFDTALQAASSFGHVRVVRMLLDSGADINGREGRYGTPLEEASDRGYTDIVMMLLSRGARDTKDKVKDSNKIVTTMTITRAKRPMDSTIKRRRSYDL